MAHIVSPYFEQYENYPTRFNGPVYTRPMTRRLQGGDFVRNPVFVNEQDGFRGLGASGGGILSGDEAGGIFGRNVFEHRGIGEGDEQMKYESPADNPTESEIEEAKQWYREAYKEEPPADLMVDKPPAQTAPPAKKTPPAPKPQTKVPTRVAPASTTKASMFANPWVWGIGIVAVLGGLYWWSESEKPAPRVTPPSHQLTANKRGRKARRRSRSRR
jgi:hypothetical protein